MGVQVGCVSLLLTLLLLVGIVVMYHHVQELQDLVVQATGASNGSQGIVRETFASQVVGKGGIVQQGDNEEFIVELCLCLILCFLLLYLWRRCTVMEMVRYNQTRHNSSPIASSRRHITQSLRIVATETLAQSNCSLRRIRNSKVVLAPCLPCPCK